MAQTIQFRRGNEANLPALLPGEPAVTLDSERVFIGGPNGNVEVAKKEDVDQIVQLVSFQKQDAESDDTARLQRALNTLSTKSILYLEPKRVYDVSSLISITGLSNITIIANGAKLKCSSSYGDVLKFQNGNNITVDGLEIEGGETNVGSRDFDNSAFISFVNCENVKAVNCTLYNGNGIGVSAIDCVNVQYINNTIYNVNQHPLWTNRCDTVLAEWNQLTGIGNLSGTLPIGTSGQVFRGGIGYLATKGNNHVIRNNTIKNISDTASKTEGTTNVIYEGNHVEDFGKDGIKIQDYNGDPLFKAVNGKIINNTIINSHYWRNDGAALILMYQCAGGVISGNILHGGVKEQGDENAIRVQYCENVIVSNNTEKTAVTKHSFYCYYNVNVKMVNNQFKKNGEWNHHTGDDLISGNDIGSDTSNLSILSINPANLTIVNNPRIAGAIQVQPGSVTKKISIRGNEIVYSGTTDCINITNFTANNSTVENVEFIDNTVKLKGTVTTSRIIRLGCDKTSYKIVKTSNNVVDRNGQTSLPLLTILADASGNGFKVADLLTGQNFPSYVHSAGNTSNVTANTTL